MDLEWVAAGAGAETDAGADGATVGCADFAGDVLASAAR